MSQNLSLDECLKIEVRIFKRMLMRYDFAEGIRAKLIEKDNSPKWKYSRVEDVPNDEVEEMFHPFQDPTHEFDVNIKNFI